jgi:hypothetical protein
LLSVIHRAIDSGNASGCILFPGKRNVHTYAWIAISVIASIDNDLLDLAILTKELLASQSIVELLGWYVGIETDHVYQVLLNDTHSRQMLLRCRFSFFLLSFSIFALLFLARLSQMISLELFRRNLPILD